MPENNLMSRISYDDVVDIKQQSLYARLKRLFATDVIVRNVGGKKLKIKDSDEIQYATDRNSLRDRFNRVRSTAYNAYTRDFALSYQAARLDLFRDYDCVGPDTIIPLPDGTKTTIKELTEKYKDKPQERFFVFSYDHKTDSIKLGKAYHPRKKEGTRYGYKVTFDNGQYVIGSIKHPFLMRDGTYKRILELKVGDSAMPFNTQWQLKNDYDYKFYRSLIDESIDKYKIVSIECIGPIDVYDVTVEEYENFATDSCFVHNTMDMDPVLSAALDILSDECTTENEFGEILTIDSKDNNIKNILHNLFYDILNIDFNLWSWVRNVNKYGDFYLKLNISPEYGVYLVEPLSAYNVERIENSDPLNKNYVKFQVRPVDTSQAEILESFQVAHFRLITDSNFLPYGRCLTFDTHIDTEFGSKYISDLNIGDKVWTFNVNTGLFELSSVKNKINSGKKEIIKICTQHNFIKSSKNHPILIYDIADDKFVYKPAEEIKLQDLLVVNTNNNKISRNYKINKEISKDITCKSDRPEVDNIPEFADVEFCEFLGFMMGDGWIRKYSTGGRVCFSLGIDEIQNEKYLKILEKYSGKSPYVAKTGDKNTKSRAAVVYSKYLYEILLNNGFLPVSAKEKRIPNWVFELPSDLQMAFIIGLTEADSWEFSDKWVKHNCISLCNKDLIYDFKRLIQLNNIKSSIPVENDTEEEVEICGNKCIKHGGYSFYYYLEGKNKNQIKKYDFIHNENIFLEPVRKIEDCGENETWDIQVESENSNFVANGIIVHNSMIEPARRIWKQLCIHENSEIWTLDGYKQIKNITNNDIIYSYNFDKCCIEPTKIIQCINTGNKDTYEIKTKHRVLHVTDDHQILIKNKDNNYVYKQAKELIVDKNNGDYLILPTVESTNNSYTITLDSKLYYVKLNDIGKEFIKLHIPKIGIIQKIKSLNQNHPYKQIHAFLMGNKSIPYNIFQNIKNEFNISEEMYFLHIKNSKYPSFINKDLTFTLDENFIRFFGFMLGDGWTSGNGIGFALGIYDNINEIYTSTIKKYCDSYHISYPKNNDTHPGSFIVFSKEFKHILECAGYKTGFKNKDIPNWVYTLSKKTKKEFIKGLFDADGSWKWGVIGLSNEKMITQLKHLCQQSGIMCNEVKCYKPEETIDKFGIHRFPTYKLYINFNYEYDLEFERVLSVSLYEKNSNVYDIQVESDNHNFITNGVVIHNCLLEDALLIHRIMRAPERRIFKIDIGNIPPNEVDNFMEKTISKLKKVPYIDERTGDYNLRFNLQNMTDDYFFAVRGSDSGTSIDTLPGMEFTGIDDLEYVKTKMMAALKIPKAFLGFEEGLGKATLSAEDVRFSRTISRIQKMVIAELDKIAQVHLYAQGYRDASIVDFKLGLTNPSTIFEKEKMEIWASKLENAKSMWEMSDGSSPFFARNFVFKKIFKMSDDDIQQNEQQIVEDCKQLWRLKQISEEGNDPAKPFKKINPNAEKEGGEEGGLGGLGGPAGGPELGGPEGGPEAEGAPEAGPEAASGGEAKPMKEAVVVEKHGEPGPDYVRPSQAGNKKASDYPFGEDPLGDVENNKHSKADRSLPTRFDENLTLTYKNIIKSNITDDSYSITNKVKLSNHVFEQLDKHLTSSKTPTTFNQNIGVEGLNKFLGLDCNKKELIKEEIDYSINASKPSKIDEKNDLLKEASGESMLDEKNIIE